MRPPSVPISRRQAWWPVALAGLITLASHQPRLPPTGFSGGDKVVHFLVFGLLATLISRLGTSRRMAIAAVVLVSAFGAADEWHQSFVPHRSATVADWIADTVGAALAVGLYGRWRPYRRWLETPLRRRRSAV